MVQTFDPRPSIDQTPIEGLPQRPSEMINNIVGQVADALRKLQERTIIEPRHVRPIRAYDGQIELADGVDWNPANTGRETLVIWFEEDWHRIPLDEDVMDLILGARLIQGYYDQVNDQIVGSGAPLDAATNYGDGDYYVLAASGDFATSLPNLSGLSGVLNDRIVVGSGAWNHVSVVNDFLSKVLDDTAAGVITMNVGSDSPIPAPGPNYFERRNEVDAKLAAHEAEAVNTFTYAAYAGMNYNGTPAAFPDIGAAYQTIEIPNQLSIPNYRGITPDLATTSMTIETPGVYYLSVLGSFEHNNLNSGRTTQVRLFNLDTGTPANSFQIGVGRNVEVTSFVVASPIEVVNTGNRIVIEIGGGDTISAVQWFSFAYSIHSVGEFRGTFGTGGITSMAAFDDGFNRGFD